MVICTSLVFLTADAFQFLDTAHCEMLNITSDHSCRCIKTAFTTPLKENFTLIIFLHFVLIGLEWDSITLFTKMNYFFLPKLTFQHHLNKIYMAFYSLTWRYFNDVNGCKNLNLKGSFLWVATRKNETKLRKTEKNTQKENNSDESDFSENEIPNLNSLKPLKFEPKTNIGEIISSSNVDEDEGIEY